MVGRLLFMRKWVLTGHWIYGGHVLRLPASKTGRNKFLLFLDLWYFVIVGLPRWLSGKESACNAGGTGSIPGLGRSPGGGHGNILQYSCLKNPMDKGAWCATVHRIPKSCRWLKQLNTRTHRLLDERKFWLIRGGSMDEWSLMKKEPPRTHTEGGSSWLSLWSWFSFCLNNFWASSCSWVYILT